MERRAPAAPSRCTSRYEGGYVIVLSVERELTDQPGPVGCPRKPFEFGMTASSNLRGSRPERS